MSGVGRRSATHLVVVGTVMALCYTVQQSMMPILLPIALRLGLHDVQMGVAVTASGTAFLLSNPVWTYLVGRCGVRLVLLCAVAGVVLVSAAFAALVQWPPGDAATGFVLVLAIRGVLFGLALAAVAVSAAAFLLGNATTGRRGRAAAVIAAAPGVGIVVGPLFGLATGSLGPVTLLLAPVVPLAAAALLLGRISPDMRQPRVERSTGGWGTFLRDVWPYLMTVVSLLLLVAAIQVDMGFLLRDRTGVLAGDAGRLASWVLVAGGATFLLTQAVVVSRPGSASTRLFRVGLAGALLGVLPLAFGPNLPWLLLGAVLTAGGIGIALPGCYGRVSLAAGDAQQARVAGGIAAASGVAFAVGPVLATGLSVVSHTMCFLAIAGLLLTSIVCVEFRLAAVRSAPRRNMLGRSVT